MSIYKKLFWSAAIIAYMLYVLMMAWTLPEISRSAGGLTPFDLKFFGYDFAQAKRFLSALTIEGEVMYLGLHFLLDQIYAGLLAITSIFALRYLIAPGNTVLIWVLSLTAFLGALFDWSENHLIRLMLVDGAAGVSEDLVATSSLLTILKVICQLAPVIVVGLLIFQLSIQWVQKRQAA